MRQDVIHVLPVIGPLAMLPAGLTVHPGDDVHE